MARAVTAPDNRLDFTDQAMFLGLRATGQEAVMQVVWIYERPIDLDGVRRFHAHIGHGLLGRAGVQVIDDHLGAFAGEFHGDGAADAATRSGDDGYFAFKCFHGVSLLVIKRK